jgi:ABC-type multidrug transport system fused ATPase/permease subunit
MSKYGPNIYADSKKFSWRNLAKAMLFLFGDKKKAYLLWLAFLSLLLLYDIVPPLLIGRTVDFFTAYHQGQPLTPFYWYAFLLGFLTAVVAFLRLSTKRGLSNLRNEITYDIRINGFEKLLSQSLLDQSAENIGAKEMRVQNGITAFKSFSSLIDQRLLPATSSMIGIVAVFLFLKPVFIVVLVTYLIGFAAIIKVYNARFFYLSDERNRAMELSSGSTVESLGNIMAIKSSGAEEHFRNTVARKEEARKKFDYEIIKVTNNQWKIYQTFNATYMGVFLLLVGQGVAAGEISVGAIVILVTYLQKVITNSTQIMDVYADIINVKATVGRMMLIFWVDSEERNGHRPFPTPWNEMILEKCSFSYKKDDIKTEKRTNIRDLDLRIARNQKIGVIGKTGSGKSTLAKLLIGLYPLDAGSFRIDTTEFRDIKRSEIFKHCAIVLQESEMFNISLKENIALHGKFNQRMFDRAVAVAQLDDVIAKLPNGIDTLIGERGYHLSGGERQRIGIARAIYRDPEILILDEATSSLDIATEKKLQSALAREFKQKTIIIIAHRVNTLEEVDVIYQMEDGRIAAKGSYDDFFGLRLPGPYKKG